MDYSQVLWRTLRPCNLDVVAKFLGKLGREVLLIPALHHGRYTSEAAAARNQTTPGSQENIVSTMLLL